MKRPTCSTCGKALSDLGNALGGPARMSVGGSLNMWKGTVCTSCRSIFCTSCQDPSPVPCPKCGTTLQPAFYDLVNQVL